MVALVYSSEAKSEAREWQVREDLAASYRLLALYGWDDLVINNLSARLFYPHDHFLVKPDGLLCEEVAADTLVKVDLSGNPVDQDSASFDPSGFFLHASIYTLRRDINSVMDLQTPQGQAVSAMKCGLLPLKRGASASKIAHCDRSSEYLSQFVLDYVNVRSIIMRNCGTLSLGASVGECFANLSFLEAACCRQIELFSSSAQSELAANVDDGNAEFSGNGAVSELSTKFLSWEDHLRKLSKAIKR